MFLLLYTIIFAFSTAKIRTNYIIAIEIRFIRMRKCFKGTLPG